MAFSEDVATRFIGYGWNVTRGRDANDLGMLERAFQVFRNTGERPILIIVDRHIAYGSPTKRDSSAAQRRALGRGGDLADKTQLWLAGGRKFLVPTGVRTHFQAGIGKRCCALRESWIAKFADYMVAHPDFADQLYKMHHRQLPADWSKDLPEFPADPKGIAPGIPLARC